ncbi:hypothetical protein YC2023_084606 [Brassica napus]
MGCFGDSNHVFCPCENLDAYESNIDIQTPSLVILVIQSALDDLNIIGSSHSWWIKRRGNPTTKKLDRIMHPEYGHVRFVKWTRHPDADADRCSFGAKQEVKLDAASRLILKTHPDFSGFLNEMFEHFQLQQATISRRMIQNFHNRERTTSDCCIQLLRADAAFGILI